MQKTAIVAVALLWVAAGGSAFADPVKSGPQPGARVPGPFKPLNVTGPHAGDKVCLYCKYGMRPVVLIFARQHTAALEALVKKVDESTAANSEPGLASFVVYLNDAPEAAAAMKGLAERQGIKQTVLTTFAAAGPASYALSADADVTVVLYTHGTVKSNFAFRPGELNEAGINAVLAGIPALLPAK